MVEYMFIKMVPTQTYLTVVDPTKKSRFVCFSNKRTAEVFVDYVTNFRSLHGFWPNLDMSDRMTKVKSKIGCKKRTTEELKKYLSYDIFDYENIDEMAKRTNVSFIHITNFSHLSDGPEQQIITFSGQEWDGEADEAAYRDLLEFNLKIS